MAALRIQVETDRLVFAQAQGDNMASLASAAGALAAEHFTEFQTGTAISRNGVTLNPGTTAGQTYAPTVANLISLGYLNGGFSAQSAFNNGAIPGNYQIRIWREPVNCETVAVTTCDVVGWVYPDKAITANGSVEPDGPGIAAIMRKLGGAGGFSLNVNSNMVNGVGKSWSRANPIAGNPAGVVAARFGYVSSGLSQFVRINDDRDPNLRGNLTIQGNTKSASFITDIKVIGGACSVPNAIGTVTAGLVICDNATSTWKSLGTQAAPGDACSPDGKVATSTTTGEQLICKNGRYVKTVSLIPQNIVIRRVAVRDLDTVAKPACDVGGVADRSFSVNQTSVDVTIAPPKQSMFVTTVDQGSSWLVQIRLKDDLGNEVSANTHNVSAVLNVECKY